MRRQFTIFIILIFIFGLAPINFLNAITQNQINSEVQIVCTDGTNWFSGSGTIIDPKGIILTNRHVVEGALKNICIIGFLESINQEPNFGTKDNPNLAEVKYITTDKSMDSAILYLENKNNQSFPYVNIWNSNSSSLKFGDKIEVVGYPGIGGSTITYTSGDFSGFGSLSDGTQNYIKTTAMLEHGNSGGSAYNQRGEFVGIPSMVVTGSLNSISYVLSVDSIKKWLSGFLGSDYKQEIIEQEPIISQQPEINLQSDITPPYLTKFWLAVYGIDNNGKEALYSENTGSNTQDIYEFKKVRFGVIENNCNEYFGCIKDDSGQIKGYYYYFGTNINANPVTDGKYIKAEDLIDHNSTSPMARSAKFPDIFEVNPAQKNYFIIKAVDNSDNISGSLMNFEYNYEPDNYKDLISIDFFDANKKLIGTLKYPNPDEMWKKGGWLFSRPEGYRAWFSSHITTKYDVLYLKPNYGYEVNGLVYDDKLATENRKIETGLITPNNYIKISGIGSKKNINIAIKPNKNSSIYFRSKYIVLNIDYNKAASGGIEDVSFVKASGNTYLNDNSVNTSNLNGKILLQVESHGEAWYVNPKNGKRYYMANGDKAYNAMRNFGVGITNNNLEKIKFDKNLAKKSSGKIFLQVESKGEAYYIDFNGDAHYLKDGAAAYSVMRNLGLGIKNSDLNKIPEGSL